MTKIATIALIIFLAGGLNQAASAQDFWKNDSQPQAAPAPSATYADLAKLADRASLVVRVKVRKQAVLKPERAPGLPPHLARSYVEAETVSLIGGRTGVGQSQRYLVDLPRNGRGKAPKLKKQEFILFANPVPSRPGELQLVAPSAQIPWTPETEARLAGILREMVAGDAPSPIGAVQEALSVAGNLAGESETQFFIGTKSGGPVSISVIRRPGLEPIWGVSWSEIVDQAAKPPQRNTLGWYRLACFLPSSLPASANYAADPTARRRAMEDYQFVRAQLGNCPRNLR